MVQIPGLGSLNKQVNTSDVLVGAALGFAGTLAIKMAGGKVLAGKVPDFLLKGSPLVGGIVTGGVLYALEQKKNKAKANAHLFGALLAGASVQAWDSLKTTFQAQLGDVVSLKFQGRNGYGVFVDERTPNVGPGGYGGLIVDEGGRSMSGVSQNLAQLAAYSMGDEESSGMEELMDLDS